MMPRHELISTIESAHGVSDVNHVAWNRLNPLKAAETLRNLEGGDDVDLDDNDIEREEGEYEKKWKGVENLFASAGDDGVIKVWRIDQ